MVYYQNTEWRKQSNIYWIHKCLFRRLLYKLDLNTKAVFVKLLNVSF